MWVYLVLLVGLAAAKPIEEMNSIDEEMPINDWDNPEYGDLPEGDLDMTEEEYAAIELAPTNALRDSRRKWPRGRLPYTVSSVYSSSQRSKIKAGVDDLNRRTQVNGRKCVDLRPRSGESNYVRVERGGGCSSMVGMTGGGSQRLSLADGCFSHGTIMHEFLHALGFHHEQTRPDRDDWVSIDFSNLVANSEHNFRKYSSSQVTTLGTRYDYGSVMHYGAYAFAKDKNKPTIRAKRSGGSAMGNRSRLSSKDIEMVQVHYGCKNARDTVYFKHLSKIPEYNMQEEWLKTAELVEE